MNVQVELKFLRNKRTGIGTKDEEVVLLRSITPSFYNWLGVGYSAALAKMNLVRRLPGGVDYEFEIVGF